MLWRGGGVWVEQGGEERWVAEAVGRGGRWWWSAEWREKGSRGLGLGFRFTA